MMTDRHRRDGSSRPRAIVHDQLATRSISGLLILPLLALLAVVLLIAPARAAKFDVHAGDELNIIVVTDEILPGDDEHFLAAVEEATWEGQSALVVLASPGGALGAGMHMGLIIAENGLPTFVPDGEVCASACALAWLAGAPRMMTEVSEIGFHQPYDERDGVMVPSIEANAVVGHYIATIGMGPQIVSFAVSAPPQEMSWLQLSTASDIGLEVTEVSASAVSVALGTDVIATPREVAGLDRRVPPTDEAFVGDLAVPLPVMRQLTASEVASLRLSGAIDVTGAIGTGLPVVTVLAADEADAPAGLPVPWGLRLALSEDIVAHPASDEVFGSAPSFDVMSEGEEVASANDSEMSVILREAFEPSTTEVGIRNVERAVVDAVRSYGEGGSEGLRLASSRCWSDLRDDPSAHALQYCHVIDLVAAEVVEPGSGEFAPFAVAVRLRAHRAMVEDARSIPTDFADSWGAEASMVVAAMNEL